MPKRLLALITFLLGVAWPYFWEFVRSWVYERTQHLMEPLVQSYDAVLHYGPAVVLVMVGLLLFMRENDRPLGRFLRGPSGVNTARTTEQPLISPVAVSPDWSLRDLFSGANAARTTEQPFISSVAVSPDWSLRDLFHYLAPPLPLRATKKIKSGAFIDGIDDRWKPVGDLVLRQLSLGRLHAYGRKFDRARRLQAALIPPEFWRDAKFTFWFLDAAPSQVQDALNPNDSYSEIEVDRTEAKDLWPNGAEFSLLEAARQIYEAVKDAPISIVIEGLCDGPDDIFAWICNRIAKYQNGKEPLVKLRGNKPPSTKREEIYAAPLTAWDFVVEGNAILFRERYGKLSYENLSVTATDIDRAIHELAKWHD